MWRQSLLWRILVNAGWASAATPINIGLGIIQIGMMARMLGPEGLGAITLFTAVCALSDSILRINSAEAAMVYTTKALVKGDKDQAICVIRYCYFIDFLTSIVAFSSVGLSVLFLPRLLNVPPGLEWLQAVFGLTLVFQSTYWTSHALLRVADRFSWTFYQSVGHSLIKTILVGLLFVSNGGIAALASLLVALSLLDGISLYLMAHLALGCQGLHYFGQPTRQWWRVPREIWRFQMLGYVRGITKRLYVNLDSLMIGYLSNSASVGLFRSAKQLTGGLNIPTQALISSLSPEYSRLWFNEDVRRLRRLVLHFSLLLFLFFGALGICLALFSKDIIWIIFGNAFLPARGAVLILVLAAFLSMIMTPLNAFQVATGRAEPSMLAGITTVVVQAILILVLVPNWGISGAAWATVGGLLASAMIMIPTGVARLQGVEQLCTQENVASEKG